MCVRTMGTLNNDDDDDDDDVFIDRLRWTSYTELHKTLLFYVY